MRIRAARGGPVVARGGVATSPARAPGVAGSRCRGVTVSRCHGVTVSPLPDLEPGHRAGLQVLARCRPAARGQTWSPGRCRGVFRYAPARPGSGREPGRYRNTPGEGVPPYRNTPCGGVGVRVFTGPPSGPRRAAPASNGPSSSSPCAHRSSKPSFRISSPSTNSTTIPSRLSFRFTVTTTSSPGFLRLQ